MRSFDIAAVLLAETFEGYRDAAELAEAWAETDPSSKLTVGLASDPYSVGGQRQHATLTFSGACASAGIESTRVRGMGTWVPSEATTQCTYRLSVRYRAEAALAGTTLTATFSHSAFGGSVSAAITADGQWHTVSGTITDFADSSLAGGADIFATSVPGAGRLDVDDYTLTRVSPLARGIDSTCPVCALRWNGEGGYRETLSYRTHILPTRDGGEYREQMRLFPRWRVEFETRGGDAQETGVIDQWLWANQGKRVAVPRWQDALVFEGLEQSNTLINLTGGTTDDRMFEPFQRVMLWDSPTRYETVQTWQINSASIRLDVNVNTVNGSWTAGKTKVVPLVPGRWPRDVPVKRPNGALGIVPLVFDLDVVQ